MKFCCIHLQTMLIYHLAQRRGEFTYIIISQFTPPWSDTPLRCCCGPHRSTRSGGDWNLLICIDFVPAGAAWRDRCYSFHAINLTRYIEYDKKIMFQVLELEGEIRFKDEYISRLQRELERMQACQYFV